ncbi:MAG: hypothetical protein JKY22_11375 [Flavobacteriaceae bacterium]|nr:hypothetical protein [Flavobacteriaceae bacterium]
MKKVIVFAFACCTLIACKDVVTELQDDKNNDGNRDWIPEPDADPVQSTANGIAYGNGFAQWKDVSEIAFTFNVDRGEQHFERSWIWEPKNNWVQMMTATDTVRYRRSKMDSTHLSADQAFINDKYWLLAPYQLIWDKGAQLSEKQNQRAPISGDTLDMLTITYADEGGYTPGDAYDFYFGKDFVVKEWVFREGNDSVPTMTNTWEDYEDFNGIKIAKMHKDSTENFKLYFTNISVKKQSQGRN